MIVRAIETCPKCHVEFDAPTYKKSAKKTYWKKCPNGHENTTATLRKERYAIQQKNFSAPTMQNWLTQPIGAPA